MRIAVSGINTAGKTTDDGLVLNGITVVDTRTGELTTNMAVLLVRGRIQQILPAGVLQERTGPSQGMEQPEPVPPHRGSGDGATQFRSGARPCEAPWPCSEPHPGARLQLDEERSTQR